MAVPGGREAIMRKSLSRTTILAALVLGALPGGQALAKAARQQSQQPSYTMPEYNAYQACQAEKDLTSKAKCLDGFVAQFPNSTLLQYVYQIYYQTEYQLKNYAKAIEYADKLVALGDKADLGLRIQAVQAHVQLFGLAFDPKAPDAQDQLTKERDAAKLGVTLLTQYKSSPNSKLTDDQYKQAVALFSSAEGFADLQLKDNAAAVQAFKAALANNPNDAVSEYRLGLAYLALNPPQSLDGFWALARAVDQKVPDGDKIKDYLRRAILAYEQPGCDSQVDAQVGELLQLAANSPDRPSTYTIPSQDDLTKIRQSSNIITVISDLSAGGDKAKMTWLAICGAEFPEVVGKIIDVQKSDAYVDFMVFTGATPDEMQAATMPNMDVKVWTSTPPASATPAAGAAANATPATPIPPQPDVVRLQKDDGVRFSGTLVSYDPSPFLLHWDQVKVDPSIIPEKSEAGKHTHKIPPKQ
jgi:tetratricopeptide (TPR) repeat protein